MTPRRWYIAVLDGLILDALADLQTHRPVALTAIICRLGYHDVQVVRYRLGVLAGAGLCVEIDGGYLLVPGRYMALMEGRSS